MGIKKLFKKKEEKEEMPYTRGVIVLSENAIEGGINDDLNKEILIYEGEELVRKEPYSKSMVETLRDIQHIPIHASRFFIDILS